MLICHKLHPLTPGVPRSRILSPQSSRHNTFVKERTRLKAELRPAPGIRRVTRGSELDLLLTSSLNPHLLAVGPAAVTATPEKPINLSDQALQHLKKLREESGGQELLLRVGVKSGGCSGLSYTMDFEEQAAISKDDTIIAFEGFKIVTDAMSLLYLFGSSLTCSPFITIQRYLLI